MIYKLILMINFIVLFYCFILLFYFINILEIKQYFCKAQNSFRFENSTPI